MNVTVDSGWGVSGSGNKCKWVCVRDLPERDVDKAVEGHIYP